MKRVLFCLLFAASFAAEATTPAQTLQVLEIAARATPGFAGFSSLRGAEFFGRTGNGDWSCATCHTTQPLNPGRHATTGKAIEPLAPAANSARFTDIAKVEKWFRRNCKDVLGRECSVTEKGDVLAYMLNLKP
jgi:hypothetical protein